MNIRRTFCLSLSLLGISLISTFAVSAPDSSPQVELVSSQAGPRQMENLTSQSIVRDYKRAWQSLADAHHYGSPALLDAYFMGEARSTLAGGVAEQDKSDLHSSYLNQSHKLEAVFYAPEGDVMELHDTAEFELQISDGSRLIYDQRVVAHYVVLMTPAADRWVVRQLQEVRDF